jgi:UDP-glucose:glycoprotein glucosyltransferase
MNFADNSVKGPLARFDQLPAKPILTLGMDPPESWLVESVYAVYDLDNICMDEVIASGQNITAFLTFETSLL